MSTSTTAKTKEVSIPEVVRGLETSNPLEKKAQKPQVADQNLPNPQQLEQLLASLEQKRNFMKLVDGFANKKDMPCLDGFTNRTDIIKQIDKAIADLEAIINCVEVL